MAYSQQQFHPDRVNNHRVSFACSPYEIYALQIQVHLRIHTQITTKKNISFISSRLLYKKQKCCQMTASPLQKIFFTHKQIDNFRTINQMKKNRFCHSIYFYFPHHQFTFYIQEYTCTHRKSSELISFNFICFAFCYSLLNLKLHLYKYTSTPGCYFFLFFFCSQWVPPTTINHSSTYIRILQNNSFFIVFGNIFHMYLCLYVYETPYPLSIYSITVRYIVYVKKKYENNTK